MPVCQRIATGREHILQTATTLALPQHMCVSPEHEYLQQVSDFAHAACVGLRVAH